MFPKDTTQTLILCDEGQRVCWGSGKVEEQQNVAVKMWPMDPKKRSLWASCKIPFILFPLLKNKGKKILTSWDSKKSMQDWTHQIVQTQEMLENQNHDEIQYICIGRKLWGELNQGFSQGFCPYLLQWQPKSLGFSHPALPMILYSVFYLLSLMVLTNHFLFLLIFSLITLYLSLYTQ